MTRHQFINPKSAPLSLYPMRTLLASMILFSSVYAIAQDQVLEIQPPDHQRVLEITKMLSAEPIGFGNPIEHRAHWDELLRSGNFASLLSEADSLAQLPFPKLTEEIYFSYYQGNDSETSKRFIVNRRTWLSKLIWAECLSNQGKYLPAIHHVLWDIAGTRSWSFPAEDRSKTNYEGTIFTIALSSSAYGYEVAQSIYLLKQRLDLKLQKVLLDALQEKIFQPVIDAVESGDAKLQYTSLTNKGNYNPVTLANVTGAALATITDINERARFIAIAERYANNYLLGFTDDGYCSEGIGYYNYGFGHYILLREQLWNATKGQIDLFKRPKVEMAARFIPSIEIINNVFPAIGDSEQYPKPDAALMYYLNRHFRLGKMEFDTLAWQNTRQFSLSGLMYLFPSSLNELKRRTTYSSIRPLRNYFREAGVLVVRPAKNSPNAMGAIIKGGHNAEMHNHNDLGSFSIVVGDELLVGDPGAATYTPKYFGSERYKLFKTTGSYGHPVPLLNGVSQSKGKDAAAESIRTSFTDEYDFLEMELSSAYPDTSLKSFRRSMTYRRSGTGQVTIKDDFAFTSPGQFEGALITRYPWRKVSDNELVIIGEKSELKVRLNASPGSISIVDEIIDEGPQPYSRIAVRLNGKTDAGWLEMIFETL